MLGGFKERWELPFGMIQKVVEQTTILLSKATSYLDDAQKLTNKAARIADKLETLIDQEEKLKGLEAERTKLEIAMLKARLESENVEQKEKEGKKGGRKSR